MNNDELDDSASGFIGFAKAISILSCQPVCRGDAGGRPAARLVFDSKAPFLPALSMDLNCARQLVTELVNVLAFFDDSLATKLQPLIAADNIWASAIRLLDLVPPKVRPIRPSRSRDCPAHPITDRDVWKLICLLRNCADHESFLKFIGAPNIGSDGG